MKKEDKEAVLNACRFCDVKWATNFMVLTLVSHCNTVVRATNPIENGKTGRVTILKPLKQKT